MKRLLIGTLLVIICGAVYAQSGFQATYPISPVAFTSVSVEANSFWGERLAASRAVTIPLAFSKCEETGRYDNFIKAAHPSDSYEVGGLSFDDTDVYKTIEGASYLLQTYPDAALEAYIDSVLAIVAGGQEPDGYLYTSRTMNPAHPHEWAGPERWSMVEVLSHEFYNLGHMVEGAVAHYQATGKTNFLDIAKRYADCVIREIGEGEGQVVRVPGHQIAEMALAKLYLLTGERKYLDQAKFFLDKRGYTTILDLYSQSHKPVLEQDEAVGHAVRAGYMYAGMADVAALTGEQAYIDAIDRIWDNIVSKKLYITGGVGATSDGEAFGANYELPNMSAYCETCAAIANVYVNYRLFMLHGDSKYYDVLERSLYNGVISGISIDGGNFFYPNPLQSMGQHQRQPWFGCACCPSNACRFVPSIPGYIYAQKDNEVYVNLYMPNVAEVNGLTIKQVTDYPWCGTISIEINKVDKPKVAKALKLRIPGWVRGEVVPSDLYTYADGKRLGYKLTVNGQEVDHQLINGYATIERIWKKGDKITLHLDMEPRVVKAHKAVETDKGRIAIERGPLVYCAEWPDNDFDVLGVLISRAPLFSLTNTTMDIKGQTHNYVAISTEAQTLNYNEAGKLVVEDVTLTLIPYYAWAHRGSGNMAVWLAQDLSASRPTMPATIASSSNISASHMTSSIRAINDRLIPADENDRSVPYYHWWPVNNTTEWIVYELAAPTTVHSATLYWFDDEPWGECRVPTAWTIYYRDAQGEWQVVDNLNDYKAVKGAGNTLEFTPVTTSALKLEVVQPEKYSCGIYEWELN